jgi:hypothetical protein
MTKEFSEGRPLAAKTVRHIGGMLYTALSEADRLGLLNIPHPRPTNVWSCRNCRNAGHRYSTKRSQALESTGVTTRN